jgi:hypothetical protein
MPRKKKLSRLAKALLEMAGDMRRVGIMSEADYRAIVIRHLGPQTPNPPKRAPARSPKVVL